MNDKPHFEKIESLKGIAIIGVVIAHMSFKGKLDSTALEAIHYLQLIFGWCVIAFFFASGYLNKEVKSTVDFFTFFKKKIKRLLLPYLIFGFSYNILMFLFSLFRTMKSENEIHPMITEATYYLTTSTAPQIYFLIYLFFISILTNILFLAIPKKLLFAIALIFLPYLYIFIPLPTQGYGAEYQLLPIYMLSYIVGNSFIGLRKLNNITLNPTYLFTFFIIISSLLTKNYILLYVTIPPLLLHLMNSYQQLSTAINKTQLGRYSSSIYIWHVPIILPAVTIFFTTYFNDGIVIIFPIILSTILFCILFKMGTEATSFLKLWRF